MKTIACLIMFGLILISKPGFSQDTIFVPDANFRNTLTSATTKYGESYNISLYGTSEVIVPNIEEVTYLNLNRKGISDLTGIEAFYNLETMYCSDNNLESLDVSQNPKLYYLRCSENNLTQLDFSNNDSLTILFCDQNKLQSIDVSKNTKLKWLVAYKNELTNINTQSNPNLQYFYCYENNLQALDLSHNDSLQWLLCNTNKLGSLDLTSCLNLEFLYCHENELRMLDLNFNSKIDKLKCQDNQLVAVMMPEGYYLTTLEKDESTILETLKSRDANPNISEQATGLFELGDTDALLQIYANTNKGGQMVQIYASTDFAPTILGTLPANITYLFPEKYWRINTELDSVAYTLILDLSDFYISTNFNSLFVLKRHDEFSSWENVAQIPGVTLEHADPYVIIRNLTSFSDFAIGGNSEVALPVEILSFTSGLSSEGIMLNWRVASETNNLGFILNRNNYELSSYKNTSALIGRGTSQVQKTYSFLDSDVNIGQTYRYKLFSVDFSGEIHEYPESIERIYLENPEAPVKNYSYKLAQNYPNPFNPATTIEYSLAENTQVELSIFDVLGRKVLTLVNEFQSRGNYKHSFDASILTSGVYLYQLSTPNYQYSRQMILLK